MAVKSGSSASETMIRWVIAVAEVLAAPPPSGTEIWSYFCQG